MKISLLFFIPLLLVAGNGGTVDFNRDVRPILSDKCFTCHGPDAAAKKIPFRLDQEASARTAIAGDAASSSLVKRITAEKPGLRMPPTSSGLKLSSEEIQTLSTWIDQGAKWQKHWSLIPPERKPPPAVADSVWAKNPIDSFVLQQIEEKGLKPSPEASKETLLRRVTLDLTGLPPTPAEIDAFTADQSPTAYENVVGRLLASPRYGERMAVRWLDAARYADTNGYQFDGERFMWRWRDWVIQAFNRNQPFDQFTVEQIAGDLTPGATTAQKVATGFNRNHRANTEDGIVPEEYAVEYVVDRVETTSTVFLGLTLGCARCHNHKYDPLSQKEFYQFFAYFNNVPELGRAMKYGNSPPYIADPTPDQQAALDALDRKARTERSLLDAREKEIARGQKAWEPTLKSRPPDWWHPASGMVNAFDLDSPAGLIAQDGIPGTAPGRIRQAAAFDGKTWYDAGKAGSFDIGDRFSISVWVHGDQVPDGSLVSRMTDSPTGKGYGVHLDKGKVQVTLTSNYDNDAIRVETAETLSAGRWHHLAVTYNGLVSASGLQVYIDGKPAKLNTLMDTLYRPFSNAGKQFKEPFRIGAGQGKERRFRGELDDVRLYSRVLGQEEIEALALGASANDIAAVSGSKRTDAQKLALRRYYIEHVGPVEVRELQARIDREARERESLEKKLPTVMVMAENPVRRKTHLLLRGAYDKPGPEVERGVPAVLPPLPEGLPNDRLGLAKWIVDPRNPLTARVTVNRFWQMYFGAGLVKTIEDFGLQGDWPSNPDLLDWLATEFVRTGWDVKALQKLIVTSATYRQSSQVTPELMQKDPENRLLARGPRHRLAPEIVRDQALAAAGLLTEKLGGPSVKPYQPAGLWKEQAMQDMDYEQSKGPDLYRRSLYTFWKRTIPPPMMMNFDAAGREACVVREDRTNTPLQALNLMNDVTFVEAARFIGQRMMKEGGADAESKLQFGMRLLTGRRLRPEELRIFEESLSYHRDYFASDLKRAQALLKQGDSPADSSLPPADLAAYASVASLMLNLDEVISKE